MKKILLTLTLLLGFSFNCFAKIEVMGDENNKIYKETINDNVLWYDDSGILKSINLYIDHNNLQLTYRLFFLESHKRFSFSVTIITNQKINIDMKDRYFNNIKLQSCEPSNFDDDGYPLEYTYRFRKEFYNMASLMKDLSSENITLFINDRRCIINNPYKNNKLLKERIIELSVKSLKNLKPEYSQKEIEEELNLTEVKKYL